MDPRTTMILATLMALLNGGVLGLMQRGLSADLQGSAADWRIGTLLAAGCAILFSVQDYFAPGFILPLANGSLFVGLTLYWRSIRRFDGRPERALIFLPAAAAIIGTFWFAEVEPSFQARVFIATLASVTPLSATAVRLLRSPHDPAGPSRSVLAVVLSIVVGFVAFRGVYFLVKTTAATSVLNDLSWVNLATPVVIAVVPVVGTTAFLMMCSERMRRGWELAASTDYLTGLPNRRTISGTGAARLAAARRSGNGFTVAIIDIDHFKAINDRLGHEAGDIALKHVASALAEHCRGTDIVGRLGGEEFVALIEHADPIEALAAAERLRVSIEDATVMLSSEPIKITVSIGISLTAPGDQVFDDMLRRADRALYVAKAAGRNRVEAEHASAQQASNSDDGSFGLRAV